VLPPMQANVEMQERRTFTPSGRDSLSAAALRGSKSSFLPSTIMRLQSGADGGLTRNVGCSNCLDHASREEDSAFSCPAVRSKRLSTTQRVTDACDNSIPLPFLGCGIVDQHAMHVTGFEVATVVPDLIALDARDHEEPRRDALVDDPRWRILAGEEGCRRHARLNRTRLHGQISAAVRAAKSLTVSVRLPDVLCEDGRGNVDRAPGLRNAIVRPALGAS